MAETIAIAGIVASVASAGLGIVQGIQGAKAAEAERQQYEMDRKIALVAADQEEVARRRRLHSILSTNEAIRGASGVTLRSGSADAIRKQNIKEAEEDIGTARLNQLGRARRAQLGVFQSGLKKTGAILSGASSFLSGVSNAGLSAQRYIDLKKKA